MSGSAANGSPAQGDFEDRPATGFDRFAETLIQANGSTGEQLTSIEFAEVLWLAQHLPPAEAPGSSEHPEASVAPGRTKRTEQTEKPESAALPAPSRPSLKVATPGSPQRTDRRVPLHLPDPPRAPDERAGTHTPLLAPAPPMLSHPLALQRALRSLKRQVPAVVGLELDEEATAHRIARLRENPRWWLPVLRPVAERWLTLRLVYDVGPTMPLWRPLIRELHSALVQSGVFRTVELNRLAADGTLRGSGAQEPQADGRTVALLITDCMGPQWRESPAGTAWYRTLRRWCVRMPVAVVQPLPERLWRTTALPSETARIGAPRPAAPNSSYEVHSYVTESARRGARSDALPVPVLESSAPWLANWSQLVAYAGRVPGSVAWLETTPPTSPVDDQGLRDVERLSPEQLLLRFRSVASPEAFRLAGHLAVGRPSLAVMRLVQAAIEPDPQPQHLAEVILSGMLMTVPGQPPGSYDFRPGVREALLRTLPRSARHLTTELLTRIGALIDERAGVAAGEFQVAAPGVGSATAETKPIATVREESVRRMGGEVREDLELLLGTYRIRRELGCDSGVWQAEDVGSGRIVAVYRYDVGSSRHEMFLDRAQALSEIRHANVVGVHDFGIWDGDAWLITDFVEGVTLAELTAEGSSRLPYWMLTSVANQVAQCLALVHSHGLAHGRLTPNCLLLCPDGTVKVTRFALERAHDSNESTDLSDLGHMLSELLGESATAEHRTPDDTELPRARRAFREPFADAVENLLSADLDQQRRGRDLFVSPAFDKRTAATIDPYRYRLLGPVRVTRDDQPLTIASPREQALLCMLLLRSGRAVTHRELAEGLWGDKIPEHADQEISLHVSRLRRTLGAGILATTPDGYVLYATPRTVDVNRLEDLVAKAEFRREDGEISAARDIIQYALDLWQGEPLDGAPGPAAEAARTRLRALHLTLRATLAELDREIAPQQEPPREP